MKPLVPPREAWKPAPWSPEVAYAVKAFFECRANEEQQRIARDWILQTASAVDDLSYRPESDRDTSFAEGRRFVGLQIRKVANLRSDEINGKVNNVGSSRNK